MRHVHVRAASLTDLDVIVACRRAGALAAFGQRARETGCEGALLTLLGSPEAAEEQIADPQTTVLVASIDDEVVGTAAVRLAGSAELSSCYCRLTGQGAGSALMRQRLALARAAGLTCAWCEVDDGNRRGIEHVTRHGFALSGHRDGKLLRDRKVGRYELDLSASC